MNTTPEDLPDLDTHLARHGLTRHKVPTRARMPRAPAPIYVPPTERLINALERAYPRADVDGDAYWLGNGLIHVQKRARYVELIGFWVAPNRRRAGHGTLMLDTLCALADRYGVELRTWADPYDAGRKKDRDLMGPGELRKWYARWGFFPTVHINRRAGKGPRILAREPRPFE